jgi:4-hydroxybenzoate polyprenyltransferase
MGINQNVTVCVDCDGTLIATDLLHEAFFLMLKQYPLGIILIPFWLLQGKAHLKARIAERVVFNWATLPYRTEVLGIITQAREQGRTVILATASPVEWANGIAQHLKLFDEVLATQDGVNLAGKYKAEALVGRYGEANFDYIGDSKADFGVWKHAKSALVVTNSQSFKKRAQAEFNVAQVITPPGAKIKTYVKALRVHQWLKNGLIFLPLLAAHQISNMQALLQACFAFIAFSACASSVYVLNDLLDLESDRIHIRKRKRPFASCLISIKQGAFLVPILIGISLAISLFLLPQQFLLVLLIYLVITLAYSIRLKRQVIVDVMLLGGLYTMRIIAGGAATNITPSFWLLAFSMFIFLSLALVKRYSEMLATLQQNKAEAAGRGYSVTDLPVLMSIGVSSSMVSVLIFSLYINLPETKVMYPNSLWLWGIPAIVLYWNSRVWMKVHRGEVDDDPIVFAIKDWQSLVIIGMVLMLFLMASL